MRLSATRTATVTTFLAALILLGACGAGNNPGQAQACRSGLDAAYADMKAAEAEGLRGAADITAAAGLLAAAETQEKFGKYPNCIDKVRRARNLIRQARQG